MMEFLAGYQIYLNRTADMQPLVTQNAAVFVQSQHDYAKENVVLYTNSAGDKTIGRISLISADTEGSDAKIIYYLNSLRLLYSFILLFYRQTPQTLHNSYYITCAGEFQFPTQIF